MLGRIFAVAILFAISACSKPDAPPIVAPSDPTKSAPTTTTAPTPPTATPTASDASGFPALEDACTTDADCDIAHRDRACCWVCGGLYGNKKWVVDVEAYCSGPGANAKCPPMTPCRSEKPGPALGYLMAAPRCNAGHCTDK